MNPSSELTELNQPSIRLTNETEGFINTDNPYSSLPPNAFEEVMRKYSFLQETNVNTSIIPERLKRLAELDDEEGSRPIYVLVFFDDEEEALGSTNMLEFWLTLKKQMKQCSKNSTSIFGY
ncbi:MAG: hypothetical protein QXQ61_03590 [Candidatus Bathyarchaeia archaeon]